jgi:hypothetical protein
MIRLIRLIRPIGLIVLALAAAAAAEILPVFQSSFTGGELSPRAAARIDAERYYRSALALENMIALPQGPATRRPGTFYAGATKSSAAARLIPFRYSSDDCYVLEFTTGHMRVWRSHGLVTNADASIYELDTPFDATDIAALQVWQSADVLYLVDGLEWPQKLGRVDHNDWDINDLPVDDGPFLTENLTNTTVAANATTGTGKTLTASTPIFLAGHVGSYWRLRDLVAMQRVSGTLAVVDTNSATVPCQAAQSFEWEVHGTFVGTVELQLSYDGGATWAAYAVLSSTSSATTTPTVYGNDSGQDVELRVRCTEYTSGTISYQLWAHAYMHTGVAKVTAYTDPCNVTATIVRTLASTDATVYWSEGAWSTVRGFPRAIGSYSDRLVLAGTTHQPVTIWMSATGDYESFDAGTGLDDESFGYTLGRSEQDPIVWLVSHQRRGLLAGTTGSVLELTPLDTTQGIKPANPPTVANVLALPCASVAPILADNVLLVLQRGGRKVRELLYSVDVEGLVAPDLTLMADHVTAPTYLTATGGALTAWAWAMQPYPILWGVRSGDGALVSCVYDRNYQLVAWSHHHLGDGGVAQSCCVIPGEREDELWLVVARTINGAARRYVEYLAPWQYGPDQHDGHFVDCGLVYDGAAATTISGAGHLAGESVALCADSAALAAQTVAAGGTVTLPYAASVVHLGLPYTSTLQTVRYDFAGAPGSTWARPKTINKATVSFYETLGAQIGPDTSRLREPVWYETGAVVYGGVPGLVTGDREVTLATTYATDHAQLVIVQSQPLPLTVRAIAAQVEVH